MGAPRCQSIRVETRRLGGFSHKHAFFDVEFNRQGSVVRELETDDGWRSHPWSQQMWGKTIGTGLVPRERAAAKETHPGLAEDLIHDATWFNAGQFLIEALELKTQF